MPSHKPKIKTSLTALAILTSLTTPQVLTPAFAAGEGDFELKQAIKKAEECRNEMSTALAPEISGRCHSPEEVLAKLQPAKLPDLECKPSKSPLFTSDSVLEIKVRGYSAGKIKFDGNNLKLSADQRNAKPSMKLEYELNGAKKTLETKVESRGKSRQWSCPFPPLRFLLDTHADRSGTLIDHLKGDDLKLTVHCKYTDGNIADHPGENDDVLKEYFVYQALKAAGYTTPETRLAKVTYLNPDGKFVTEGYGFFIEPKKDLAHRCKSKHLSPGKLKDAIQGMDKKNLIPFYFAEKLIDGGDWIPEIAHNTIPLVRDGEVIAAAPYDFNDTGMVDARHADKFGVQELDSQRWKNLILEGPYDREARRELASAVTKEGWKEAVIAEAKRALTRKDAVMKALERAPFKDKEKFRAYFEAHFKTLSELAKENP
jgi:hypothetical protein